jgi:hemerythrin
MPLIEWTDRLSVSVSTIDADHKRLVQMANELYDAMKSGKGKDTLGKILDGLVSYTRTHFAREESYMSLHDYPQAAEHRAQHADFVKKVGDVKAKFDAGESSVLSMQVLNFLAEWLAKHIQGSDRALGAFLLAKKAA